MEQKQLDRLITLSPLKSSPHMYIHTSAWITLIRASPAVS